MKDRKCDEATRTIEMRLDHPSIYPLLDQLLDFFAHMRHLLWRDLIVKGLSINDLKKSYISDHGLTARQFNSLAKEVSAKKKALQELQEINRTDLEAKISATTQKIGSLLSDKKRLEQVLTQIANYRKKCLAWKMAREKTSKPLRKPKMPAKIKNMDRVQLIKKVIFKNQMIHQKKRRLAILKGKLEALKSSQCNSVCFGSKAFFKHQFNLEKSDLSSHEEWKKIFRLKRASQAFFVGSSDESAGNQTIQYCPFKKSLKIRLPKQAAFKDQGSHLELSEIEFPEHLRDEFYKALSKPECPRSRNQKTTGPVSYRILRRFNPKSLQLSYYIQACFSIPEPEFISRRENGAIGLDINSDHLAFTEVDRFGNYIESSVIPFDFKSKSSDQIEALIGDMMAVLGERCEERQKPLIIEDLDFTQKKASLREQGKSLRSMLSSLTYTGIRKAISSRCRKGGIETIAVNPAYTSLIGSYKFQGLKISSHKKAALAIARRGLRLSEYPNVYQVTFSAQVMMQKPILKDPKHVWKFYRDNQAAIRKLIRNEYRPLQASKSILSSGSGHRSLMRSLQCERGSIGLDLPSRRSV